MSRIAQVVVRRELHERSGDAAHWRSRPPAERLAALEQLRRQQHGELDDLRRNRASSGRPQDTADLAALEE